jgi:hypothetical protein
LIDKTVAAQFLHKIVKIETDSNSYNYYKGVVREVTERALILEFMTGRIVALDLFEITVIREAMA